MTSSRSISRRMEHARSVLTERSSCSRAATLGDIGVRGVVGCERVDGVCSLSVIGVGSGMFAPPHLKREANAPGDFALGRGFSMCGFEKSFGGMLIGAGGANATVMSFSRGRMSFMFTGEGIDIRRGLKVAAMAACCNFFDDSVRLRSSFDLRGSLDRTSGRDSGEEGGEGSCFATDILEGASAAAFLLLKV